MLEIIKNLEENLRRQLLLLEEFERLATIKRDALVSNNIKQLEAVITREEQLLMEFGPLNEVKLALASSIGEKLGKAPEEITLAEIQQLNPELKSIYQEVSEVTNRLVVICEGNALLLAQSLKITNFAINLLTQDEQNTYKRPETKNNGIVGHAHLLDRSV